LVIEKGKMAQSEIPKSPRGSPAKQPVIRHRAHGKAWAPANIQRDQEANEQARLGMKAAPIVRGQLWPKRRGEVSELAFFYKAAALGFGVAKPWGDSERYDFILDSGQRLWRVQVKSACHHFKQRYGVLAVHGNEERTRYTSADIDILVAYLTPIETWYVIPVEKLDRKKLYFYPHGSAGRGRYEAYREAWSVMAPGPSRTSGLGETELAHPGQLNPRFL